MLLGQGRNGEQEPPEVVCAGAAGAQGQRRLGILERTFAITHPSRIARTPWLVHKRRGQLCGLEQA